MTLDEIRKAYEDLSSTLSTVCRQLTFAGIGISWMYVLPNRGINGISFCLKASIVSFAAALFLDIVQYSIQTYVWYKFYHDEKNKAIKKNKDNAIDESKIVVLEPEEKNKKSWVCFGAKIFLVGVAYIFLLIHVINALFK